MAELFDSDGSVSEEEIQSPGDPKKKRSTSPMGEEHSEAPKKKFRAMLDLEAAESGDEGDGDDGDLEPEEPENEYEYDGFVVAESDSEAEVSAPSKPKKNLQRLKRAKPKIVEEDDIELIRDNKALEVEKYFDEIAPESVRDEDNKEVEDLQPGAGADPSTTTSTRGRYSSRYEEDYESDDLDFVVDDDEDANDDGVAIRAETEDSEERRRRRREKEDRLKGSAIAGPLREQLEEAAALFGEGYEDYLEDEEEEDDEDVFGDIAAEKELKKVQILRSKFERSTLVESFCTDMDEVIRNTDRQVILEMLF